MSTMRALFCIVSFILLCTGLSVEAASLSSSSSSSSQDRLTVTTTATIGATTAARPRNACKLYLWNAPSALFHKWCQHLMKDQVIEGRGGVKFVRIEPGSILQLLYPCSRYSPDSCLFCGGTFVDHMTLAWSKHLYTPFDKYVDAVKENGVTLPPLNPPRRRSHSRSSNSDKQRQGRSARRGPPPAEVRAFPRHVFHRMYVQDTVQEAQPQGTIRHHRRRQRQEPQERGILRSVGDVTYRFPFQQVTLLRALVLMEVEVLLRLENYENQMMRRKMDQNNDADSCC